MLSKLTESVDLPSYDALRALDDPDVRLLTEELASLAKFIDQNAVDVDENEFVRNFILL
jgi:hypothetical protein